MGSLDGLEMESNVGRDVLSTAAAFGNLPKVVAEYVSNSIDAGEDGQAVSVTVTKRSAYGANRIVIEDDACGMDDSDLRRFFYMHAENEARRRGRRVRGVFGTGKAAAFGIGTSLQVETARNGQKWVVRLEKAELVAAGSAGRKPQPKVLENGSATTAANGTRIIVDGVGGGIRDRRVVSELQRRLGRHLQVHNVVVFGERVQLVEPRSKRSWTFPSAEEQDLATLIGNQVVCTIHVAVSAVDEELRGVIVTANDFPVAQIQGTGDHAPCLFGSCEVAALEADSSIPGPYADTRDMTLNEDNATAGALAAWVRRCLAKVGSDLAAEEREQRRRAQDAALRNAASRMEEVLNRHFHGEFRRARNPVGELGVKITDAVPDADGNLVRPGNGFAGYDVPKTEPREGNRETSSVPVEEEPSEPAEEPLPRVRARDPFGEGRGEALDQNEEPKRRRRSGGFKIEFENNGEGAPRSRYLESQLLILVNLDHPELAAAHRAGDSAPFRMLAFEAAAQEYSFATAYVRIDDDKSIDPSDIVEYVRATIESLTRDVAEVIGDLALIPLVTPIAATG
jgi:hypothetical protein